MRFSLLKLTEERKTRQKYLLLSGIYSFSWKDTELMYQRQTMGFH